METSTHHVWWNKAKYRSPLQRSLRDHEVFKYTMIDEAHKELHAQLGPPPQPDANLMHSIIRVANEGTSPYDGLLYVVEFCLEQDESRTQRIGHHLLNQAGYIMEGSCV